MDNKARVKIIVATHKKCQMPSDEMYYPLHVGANRKSDNDGVPLDLGIAKDNTGENISDKNLCFGTQTALYWAWKNLTADYIGLVHYRRYFLKDKIKKKNIFDSVLTGEELYPLLEKYRVFVPKKRHYYIETIYSHYSNTMNGGAVQLDLTRKIIQEKYPEYLSVFDKFMKQRSAYIFNMMILERDLLDNYCSWLFDILFELEKRLDVSEYNSFDLRYAGRISERLFNIWLLKKIEEGIIANSDICELPYNEEVNWSNKCISFMKAKIFKKKYGASF